MNNLSYSNEFDEDVCDNEHEENQLVLSQRINAHNMAQNQLQKYASEGEDNRSFQAAQIQSNLQQKLGPEYISYRAGPGGTRVSYLESNKAIELANEIFGHDSWSSEIIKFEEKFCEKNESGRWTVCIMCTVKVTIRSGAFHQDCGFGNAENQKSLAAAMEKAHKEASTDALKRCLRLFGNATGNCVYDKKHLVNLAKMKAPIPAFDPRALKRGEGVDSPHVARNTSTTTTSSSTKMNTANSHSTNGATPPQTIGSVPQDAEHREVNQADRQQNNTKTASPVSCNTNDAARQQRLQQAALRREELLRKKVQIDNEPQTSIITNETSATVDSNPAASYTVQFPVEEDEYADEMVDFTPSQLNTLSKHDSFNHTNTSNDNTLINRQNDLTPRKMSPTYTYKLNESLSGYKRGGVVENDENTFSHQGDSKETTIKRGKYF